jgi:hypothetical protein
MSRRVALFSTLNGPGSRALVGRVAAAAESGELGELAIAALVVNRAPGESEATDAAVAEVEARYPFPVLRHSAVRFQPARRKAARAAAAAGDERDLWAWRDDWYGSFREGLPATDLDLTLGDLWVWGRRQCAERRGVNLHPALPDGPLGKLWYEVIWDLVVTGASHSGVMLHRITPVVDEGPVVSWCAFGLTGPGLDPMWNLLPGCDEDRRALVASQRLLRGEADHPLFLALRAAGVAREGALVLATLRALAEGRLALTVDGVSDGSGRLLPQGLDLTAEVEALLPS